MRPRASTQSGRAARAAFTLLVALSLGLLLSPLGPARAAAPTQPHAKVPAVRAVEGAGSGEGLRLASGAGLRMVNPAAPLPEFGVQFHGLWSHMTTASRAATLDRIAEGGASWVRLDISWAMIQPQGAGSYDLQWGVPLVNEAITMATKRGLDVLATFWLTPGWANGGAGERVAPHDPAAYGRALAWAAKRWEGKVAAWEIWNEPNSSDFFVGANPAKYTKLLCAGNKAVKDAGVDARVVYGGTMYNDSNFIRATYAAGAKGCYDVMATHPYMAPADAPPGLADDGTIWRLRHLTTIREIMADHGDLKPIWATEFGWSAHSNTGGEANWTRGVTEAEQALYAVKTLEILRDSYPYVRKAFWYNDTMKQTGDGHQDGYGLLRRDFSPRPVWTAVRTLFV